MGGEAGPECEVCPTQRSSSLNIVIVVEILALLGLGKVDSVQYHTSNPSLLSEVQVSCFTETGKLTRPAENYLCWRIMFLTGYLPSPSVSRALKRTKGLLLCQEKYLIFQIFHLYQRPLENTINKNGNV